MRSHYRALVLLGSLGACETPPPDLAETPARQFVAERVRIEEMKAGKVLWSGVVERADGDLATTDVRGVQLVRHPQKPNEPELTVHAPVGSLALDRGNAHFDDVRITRPDGASLTARAADYDEKAGLIVATGPIAVDADGLTATAASGVVYLEGGRLDLTGPVEGRWVPKQDL